jgi:hypothetical protein
MDLLQHKRADVDLKEIEEYVMEQRIAAVKGSPSAREGWVREGQALTAVTYPAANVNPLGAPSVSTTTMTVDLALQQPTRITRMIMDLTLQRFFADRVFAGGGGVSGGAVVYDPVVANDLYAGRDVQRVSPGGEFPVLTFVRRAPQVATVEKWGGKVYVTDEARDRNNVAEFTRSMRQMANTIVRKINQRAVEVLDTAVTANSRSVSGHSWSTVVVGGSSQSAANLWPARDFGAAQLQAEQEELGIVYDLWILNPAEMLSLATVYGPYLQGVLQSMGIDIYVTNRVAAGTAYVVAQNQVGEMRIEKPLSTETWRESGRQVTWVQSDVRPLFFVDNPFAVLKFTGLT